MGGIDAASFVEKNYKPRIGTGKIYVDSFLRDVFEQVAGGNKWTPEDEVRMAKLSQIFRSEAARLIFKTETGVDLEDKVMLRRLMTEVEPKKLDEILDEPIFNRYTRWVTNAENG